MNSAVTSFRLVRRFVVALVFDLALVAVAIINTAIGSLRGPLAAPPKIGVRVRFSHRHSSPSYRRFRRRPSSKKSYSDPLLSHSGSGSRIKALPTRSTGGWQRRPPRRWRCSARCQTARSGSWRAGQRPTAAD